MAALGHLRDLDTVDSLAHQQVPLRYGCHIHAMMVYRIYDKLFYYTFPTPIYLDLFAN